MIKSWVREPNKFSDITIPDMDDIEIITEELKFSNALDNIQVTLVPRRYTEYNFALKNYK